MARGRKSGLSLTADQAHQALTFLMHEGKIAVSEVRKAIKSRDQEIREIRERLAQLGAGALVMAERAGKRAGKAVRAAEKASRPRRKKAVSAATKAARQAQGRYMAAVRRLSKKARKQIREIRANSGIDAAITAAKKLAR